MAIEVKLPQLGQTMEEGTVVDCKVKIGDEVLFGKYSGTEVKLDGTDFLVMREEDIMAVVQK